MHVGLLEELRLCRKGSCDTGTQSLSPSSPLSLSLILCPLLCPFKLLIHVLLWRAFLSSSEKQGDDTYLPGRTLMRLKWYHFAHDKIILKYKAMQSLEVVKIIVKHAIIS